jgi:hypothetical protein
MISHSFYIFVQIENHEAIRIFFSEQTVWQAVVAVGTYFVGWFVCLVV